MDVEGLTHNIAHAWILFFLLIKFFHNSKFIGVLYSEIDLIVVSLTQFGHKVSMQFFAVVFTISL